MLPLNYMNLSNYSTKLIYPLQGAIQHYAWGGYRFLPYLLGTPNEDQQPFAEYWMGAHPGGESKVMLDPYHATGLSSWIGVDPASILGEQVLESFGPRLPYLFKVLDVRKMLSIQAHPTKSAAEAGFKRENELGIPLQAAFRNYKDDNHKPEIMVALSDFWLLHGFRQVSDIRQVLEEIPEWADLIDTLDQHGFRELYREIMEMPQAEIDRRLEPLSGRLENALIAGRLHKSMPDYWAAWAFRDYTTPEGYFDRGIFSIYFLNLVNVAPGQGIFQGAGIPHAYLEGVNIELMANSDNVFRGGLTPKHIDVYELIQNLVFDPITPQLTEGAVVEEGLLRYVTPSPDFELWSLELQQRQVYNADPDTGPAIWLIIEGELILNEDQLYQQGSSFFVPAGVPWQGRATENTRLFRAGMP